MSKVDSLFSKADARQARHKAEEIEQKKLLKQRERLSKTKAKEAERKAEFRAKFIAPFILIISIVISILIWASS